MSPELAAESEIGGQKSSQFGPLDRPSMSCYPKSQLLPVSSLKSLGKILWFHSPLSPKQACIQPPKSSKKITSLLHYVQMLSFTGGFKGKGGIDPHRYSENSRTAHDSLLFPRQSPPYFISRNQAYLSLKTILIEGKPS